MRQAIVLAGGKGTRLRERLGGKPKPLVDVDGVPLLARQLKALRMYGVTDVLLLVSHAADQIEHFIADSGFDGLAVTLVHEGEPRGTAGALLAAIDRLAPRFLVIYGDTLFDVDIGRLWDAHVGGGADATLLLHPNDHPFDSDLVELDDAGFVGRIHAAPHPEGAWVPNLVNAAMYVMERESIAFWRDAPPPSDIARDLFPAMLRRGARLLGYRSFEYIKDVGTPARLDKAVKALRSGMVGRARLGTPQRAVILDRDGTINELRGHLAVAEDLELVPGAAEAIKRLNDAEWRVVVVTNQPVLARGEATAQELKRIHAKLDVLLGRVGAFVDRLYFCPHHPDRGFPGEVAELKMVCECRKPAPGLIKQAVAEMNLDLRQSWLVGDSTGDMELAKTCGLRSILVRTGCGGTDGKYGAAPDLTAPDLPEAVGLILGDPIQ